MTDLSHLDATAQAELVHRGEISARELVDAAIARIEAHNPTLNAVVSTDFERAREAAERIDPHAPFAGVPFLVKDMAAEVQGLPITEGSRFLGDHVSETDSEIVRRYRAAGLVILGKTNTPEFAMMPTTEPRRFGSTRNPWDPARSPGGSSGGSAAAVAAGLVPMAHGNDGGGSIRIPAACCGLFGLKPTRGRNSLAPCYGDVIGGMLAEHVLTRSVRDSARLLDLTAGPAAGEPYPAPPIGRGFAEAAATPPPRLRIALSLRTVSGIEPDPEVASAIRAAAALCESLGHAVEEAQPDIDPERGRAIARCFATAWVSFTGWNVKYWQRRLGRAPREDDLEPATWQSYRAEQRRTPADYLLAITDLQAASRVIGAFFNDYDLWLGPSAAVPPVPLGYFEAQEPIETGRLVQRISKLSHHTFVANFTGQPAMSLPLGQTAGGLPIGVHVTGRYGDEATLLSLAAQLEAAAPWSGRRPRVFAG